jgi:hypothetical protein
MVDKPNLFSFATSKLSQDAFLCWLLAWAEGRYANDNAALHSAGRSLLGASLAKLLAEDALFVPTYRPGAFKNETSP